ncbi:MAG: hypothetical protein DKM50_12210 [Candidatus Margulisiibacteriota bacterium]|nr:MAG: hypothetical protein A2X43_01005 [Candidatus Margulisbacteria bacterium GWD2_39_127]OGI02406.1 MAG: hypothetical protein A2X42_09655 [Candidatus Margulisbacteria bacterium GWF2_38_17]OGI08539.1 MAG: hypothetical protein A2X41_07440 [Candidatus Margulisbacteria bacterium GWE2_39_32]PZM78190.1 MAG: hypothetical protein DKM50_12210 [Candidatus Margulisiibacteriota bacterium]HAR63451.1 hypothetical protein [Candidatus Margulisiibacteriota bacterium]
MKYGVILLVNGKIENVNKADLPVFEEIEGLMRFCEREYYSYYEKKSDIKKNNCPKNTNKEIKYRGCFDDDKLKEVIEKTGIVFKVEEVISGICENDLVSIGVLKKHECGMSAAVAYNTKIKNITIEANIYPISDANKNGLLSHEEFINVRNDLVLKYGDENSKTSIATQKGIKITITKARKKVKTRFGNLKSKKAA